MEAGRVIGGRYRLRREIGKGAMGSVWAAIHESLGRTVAVKFLRPTGVNPDTASARFVSEARMAAMVKHRFVVDIFDFGLTEDGVSYMVLELLEGEELGERMYYGPPMLVADAVRFVVQCLSGLAAVHNAGIVHRDLKPENIFIMQDPDGVFPKLLDFGISKMSQGDQGHGFGRSLRPPRMGGGRPTQLTLPGTVIGTPWYMAPEQLRGASDIDARADIYGMGVILWEWIVGQVPHDDDNIGDLIINLLGTGPPELEVARPELGSELAAVLRKSMAIDRVHRYQTALEMREALRGVLPTLPETWTTVQRSLVKGASREELPVESGTSWQVSKPQSIQTEVLMHEEASAVTGLSGRIQSWLALAKDRWPLLVSVAVLDSPMVHSRRWALAAMAVLVLGLWGLSAYHGTHGGQSAAANQQSSLRKPIELSAIVVTGRRAEQAPERTPLERVVSSDASVETPATGGTVTDERAEQPPRTKPQRLSERRPPAERSRSKSVPKATKSAPESETSGAQRLIRSLDF